MTNNRLLSSLSAVLICFLAHGTPVRAELDSDQEISFMSQLVDWGFSDYADKALKKLLLTRPDLKDKGKVIEAKVAISQGKFDVAEGLAASMPAANDSTRAIKLSLAKGYDNRGNTDKAQALYKEFFGAFQSGTAPTDPLLREMLATEAYEYAKRMERAADYQEAVRAFDLVLGAETEPGRIRGLKSEKATALLELYKKTKDNNLLGQIHGIADDLSWVVDLSFGHATVVRAHAFLLEGKKNEALAAIADNQEILKQLDDAVKEQGLTMSMSPWAGARHLRGEIYQSEADSKLAANDRDGALGMYGKAINEYFNVYKQYAGSDWASKSGLKAKEVKDLLKEKFNKDVQIDLGDFQPVAGPDAFKVADNFYNKKQYAEALAEYSKVINQFPETEETPKVLARMALCHANLGDALMVKVVSDYAGERFAKSEEAAKVPLLAAQYYYKIATNEQAYTWLYEQFVADFPKHPLAGGTLLNLAGFRQKAGDQEGRMAYLNRLFTDFKEDKAYTRALWMLAWENFKREEYAVAQERFKMYIEKALPGPDKATALFALGDLGTLKTNYVEAVKAYMEVTKALDPAIKNNPYDTSAEDAQKNKDLYEKARFQVANAMSRIKADGPQADTLKQKALESFDAFLTDFPNSQFASRAMEGKGRVLLSMNKFEAASETFNTLATRYPDSAEGKSANFSLIKAAVESGRTQLALDAFEKMMSNAGTFQLSDFHSVGTLFREQGLHEQAVRAFEHIRKNTTERKYLEWALYGIGESSFQLGKYAESGAALAELMTNYPSSGLFFDAKFVLAQSYLKTDHFKEGKETIAQIIKAAASKPEKKVEAGLILGELQVKEGDLNAAYASYQRISLLADMENPKIRPMIEKALYQGIKLAVQLELWADVIENCEQFRQNFINSASIEEVRGILRDAKLKSVSDAPAVPAGS